MIILIILAYLFWHANAQDICQLVLPDNVLSAKGLSTPFILKNCNQSGETAVFAQGGVFYNNKLWVYNPLVRNENQDFIKPVVPDIPKGATIALWFGSNGPTVELVTKEPTCVNGLGKSLFGQTVYCNAPEFFKKARNLPIPKLGYGDDNLICPTARSFSIVDQDPNDNVNTLYLLNNQGRISQDTRKNRKDGQITELANGSDERLLTIVSDALNCKVYMTDDLADPGTQKPSLFINELIAVQEATPQALVPAGNPMVLVDGNENLEKLNLYRIGVNHPAVNRLSCASTTEYCKNINKVGVPVLMKQKNIFINKTSPDPDSANNLYTFLAVRLNTTWGPDGLNCVQLIGKPAPVDLTVDNNGIVIDAV